VFDPWFELSKYPHIEVRFERLNGKVVGLTNGVDLIWLDDRLNQTERRCVLAHELEHYRLGHTTCQPLRLELVVCQRVARRLISSRELMRVMPWSNDLRELAEELNVTPQTLRDRLIGMTATETALIEGRYGAAQLIA
jgi:Zn-dependent peptidase ImmA (M78 family)